jgi:hypothetical protein
LRSNRNKPSLHFDFLRLRLFRLFLKKFISERNPSVNH